MSDDEIKLDHLRNERIGIRETIFCQNKSAEQIAAILERVAASGEPLLLTRLGQHTADALPPFLANQLAYDPISRTAFFQFHSAPGSQADASVGIITAGTSDAAIAHEARRTLEFNNIASTMYFDVGVAGIWRLLERIEDIRQHRVVIAVAGMDAALPSVLGGLIGLPLIAVPTSTGYGAARDGETALAACLTSCAPGLLVCNIDNGYGAATAALRILNLPNSTSSK